MCESDWSAESDTVNLNAEPTPDVEDVAGVRNLRLDDLLADGSMNANDRSFVCSLKRYQTL
jgi:hypothetical protein